MARNYFTDVVGATEEAFESGRAGMEQFRQRRGQTQAAKSLARGDVEGAKRAFGEAGMVEQVDTLAQRQRQQREAEAAMAREAEQTDYNRRIKEQELASTQAKDNRTAATEFLKNASFMLSRLDDAQIPQAFEVLRPVIPSAMQAVGLPQEYIDTVMNSPKTKQDVLNFYRLFGGEMEEAAVPANVRELEIRAQNAGLLPGTPAYQEFFRLGGRAPETPRETAPSDTTIRNTRTAAANLRKEFNSLPEVKDYKAKESSVRNMRSFARQDTAASDTAMIFAFMKMLDPTSVVREGEQANAQNATGVPDQVRNLYNRLRKGTRLNANQRSDFLSQAETIMNNSRQIYDNVANQYRDYARIQDIPVELVLPEAQAGGDVEDVLRRYGIE